jgi:hypothetical protein
MEREVFCESVDRFRCQDVRGYVKTGTGGADRMETWHTLQRLRFDRHAMAVRREVMAGFHARLGAVSVDGDTGARVFTIIGFDRGGDPFCFDIAEKRFWSRRHFMIAMANHAGAGAFIIPGLVAATQRAIVQLSEESEE